MVNGRTTAILSTDHGMIALDSPVKLKILEILENGTASFDELVEKSMKAKSTISVHLNDLKDLDLIREKTFPKDKRKKFFVLNAIYLAYSQTPLNNHYNTQMDCISILNGDSFKEKLFCALRYGMEAYGIEPKPILKTIGYNIGARIGPELKSRSLRAILEELSVFWGEHELGEMTLLKGDQIVISVIDCYHCGKMPDVGKTLCSMDEGIIEGVLTSKLKSEFSVRETECYGTGNDNCKFVIEKVKVE